MANNNDNQSLIGCFGLILLFFLIPKLLLLIDGIINLAIVLTPIAIIILIYRFDKKTQWLTKFFVKTFKLNEVELPQNNKYISDIHSLEEPKPEILLLETVEKINDKIDKIENESEKKVEIALEKYAHSIDQKNKQALNQHIFGDKPIEYVRSDEYENQKKINSKRKKEDELNIREFKQEMREDIFNLRVEGQEERFKIRRDLVDGFAYIHSEFSNLKGFVTEKFVFLDGRITTEISKVNERIGDLRVEIKQELSDFKVQVGREIVRLDKYMLQVVGKLETYKARVEKFTHEVRQVKLDAERNQVRAERMLNQAQNHYLNHQANLKVLGKDLEVAVGKISLYSSQFSTKVAQSKLMLDRASMEQVNSLKEIAHERIGVNLLRQDHQGRQRESETRMSKLINEKRHIEERMRINQNNHQQMNALRHELYMNQEQLQYERGKNNVMRQEYNLFKRLSR
ncbi:MAG: hypothetical protein AAFZ15_26355 [Bacteroidota bacterium]